MCSLTEYLPIDLRLLSYAKIINATTIGETGIIFDDPTVQFGAAWWLYGIINWILGIVTFIVVVIIVYQGYSLMVNPTDEETIKKLKKNILFIFIGILIIGMGYLLTNFFIVV